MGVYDWVYAIMYVSESMYKIICNQVHIRVEKRILCISGRKHLCALNISI